MNIGIVGSGYVGLVTGICFASKNHNVKCVDSDSEKIEMIKNGKSPIHEKGLETLLVENLLKGTFKATTDFDYTISSSDVIFICVGTPSLPDGSTNYEQIKNTSKNISKILKYQNKYKVIVVKSTCLPGTTINEVGSIIKEESGLELVKEFGLVMNPEFLREGDAVNCFLFPDRIVLGVIDEKSKDIMLQCYEDFEAPIVITDPTTAEMIKYASNSFLATKISFINEMASLSEKFGTDIVEIAKAIGMDHRISEKYLRAGIGWGGSCLPKDVRALLHRAKKEGFSLKILQAVLDTNDLQALEAVRLLKDEMEDGNLREKKITILGLAFKPDTDDIRGAPSIQIIKLLLEEGAHVVATDPFAINSAKKHISHPNLMYIQKPEEAIENADACILATEWREFENLKPEIFIEKMKQPIIIDGRRIYNHKVFRESGVTYRGIGLGK